jgi:hypothetical protein
MGKVVSMSNVAPRLADRYMERSTFDSQRTDIALAAERRDNLYEPVSDDGGERGRNWSGHVSHRSLYTAAALNPGKAAMVAAAFGIALAAGFRLRRRDERGRLIEEE